MLFLMVRIRRRRVVEYDTRLFPPPSHPLRVLTPEPTRHNNALLLRPSRFHQLHPSSTSSHLRVTSKPPSPTQCCLSYIIPSTNAIVLSPFSRGLLLLLIAQLASPLGVVFGSHASLVPLRRFSDTSSLSSAKTGYSRKPVN
jgi:hypothetical protein